MNRSTLTGLIAGAIAVTAIGAVATTKYGLNPLAEYADVISVVPNMESKKIPRESCRDELVTQQAPVKDERRIAGTAIGAVIGGVLGNQVGSGDGKKLATVAGAAAGGYAGNKVQKQMQQGNTEQVSERRCTTVYDSVTSQEGFKVTYRLDGKESVIVMDRDPGERIRIKDGAPVTGEAS